MDSLPPLPPSVSNLLAWGAVGGAGLSVASSVVSSIVITRKREGVDVPPWLSTLDTALAVLSLNLGRHIARKPAAK
jgi:hypothetical protein